jgi:hypothetical protein
MLKFTSVSGSVRAFTDIILTVTIIRTDIIDPITVRTIGTAGIVIIATGTPITGTNLIRNSHTGLARTDFRASPILIAEFPRKAGPHETRRPIFLTSVKPPV